MAYTPLTGEKCSCRPGVQRDNCPHCEGTGKRIDFAKIRARREGGEPVSAYVAKKRAELGDNFDLLRKYIEPEGVVFIVTRHTTARGRTFLPVVFFRRHTEHPSGLDNAPARDCFRIARTECEALGWRWDSKHIGWKEQFGGGQAPSIAVRELSRILFNDTSSLNCVEI